MKHSGTFSNFRFRLEIDGATVAGFSEVTGFETTTDLVDYQEGSEVRHAHKLSGSTKHGNITLKRGITNSTDLYQWHQDVVSGEVTRKTAIVVVVNDKGAEKARFEVTRAWPSKFDPGGLDAKRHDVGIETLELCNEGFKRIQ